MHSIKKYLNIILIVSTALILTSCGSKYIGWGVLYVDDSANDLDAGTLFPILQESEIRNVYTVEADGHTENIDIDRWKVSFQESEEAAEAYAEFYKQWVDIYAVNQLNGLSIRESPDGSSERIYKLRVGQTVKILGRDENIVNIADHDGYWYIVLTEDGTKGYSFDKNLKIYDSKDSNSMNASILDTELLEQFTGKTFRPEYFRDMVRDNMIDLNRFKTTRGLFAYPEEKKIILSTQEHQVSFEYTEVSQNSSGWFVFEGSSLQVEVRNENRIAIYFSIENKEYAEVMVYIENMEELIEAELERRELVFQEFSELGTVSSSAYGRIIFEENKRFSWANYNRLTPNVIPETAGTTGKIQLDYFPAKSLRNDYDGVISFAFDNIPEGGLINFLFTLSDLGIKLVLVPQTDIKRGIVEQESTSPLVIFMSGAGE